jgi:hypothetical protein
MAVNLILGMAILAIARPRSPPANAVWHQARMLGPMTKGALVHTECPPAR